MLEIQAQYNDELLLPRNEIKLDPLTIASAAKLQEVATATGESDTESVCNGEGGRYHRSDKGPLLQYHYFRAFQTTTESEWFFKKSNLPSLHYGMEQAS